MTINKEDPLEGEKRKNMEFVGRAPSPAQWSFLKNLYDYPQEKFSQ